jgi:bifunctional DNA-binding transcriptional regulator/antitoxin component of YhaV-PrlF toxin-antitoxin module
MRTRDTYVLLTKRQTSSTDGKSFHDHYQVTIPISVVRMLGWNKGKMLKIRFLEGIDDAIVISGKEVQVDGKDLDDKHSAGGKG